MSIHIYHFLLIELIIDTEKMNENEIKYLGLIFFKCLKLISWQPITPAIVSLENLIFCFEN